jgi:hypothetical protein
MLDNLHTTRFERFYLCILTVFVVVFHGVLLHIVRSSPQNIPTKLAASLPSKPIVIRKVDVDKAQQPLSIPSKAIQAPSVPSVSLNRMVQAAAIVSTSTYVHPVEEVTVRSATSSNWLEADSMQYLLREQVDIAAEPLLDIGVQFARIFPVLSGTAVVEFWIDNSGKVSRVDLRQGATLMPLELALAEMLLFEFLPAQLEGSPVASRKLVEIDTNVIRP